MSFTYVGNDHAHAGWKVFGAVVTGLVLAQVLSRLTEYFTSTETRPVREIAEATRTGPATTVLAGISSGLESSVYAIIAIAAAHGGEAHSAEAVRHKIRQLIDAERGEADVHSDDAIVEILKEAGVEIARRTVAKYREAMRIPSSVERKRLLRENC